MEGERPREPSARTVTWAEQDQDFGQFLFDS